MIHALIHHDAESHTTPIKGGRGVPVADAGVSGLDVGVSVDADEDVERATGLLSVLLLLLPSPLQPHLPVSLVLLSAACMMGGETGP